MMQIEINAQLLSSDVITASS